MGIEILKAMNEGMYPSLLVMIKAIELIIGFLAIAGIAISLASIAWLCFEETRPSITAPRTARHAAPSHTWKSAPRVPDTQQNVRKIKLRFKQEVFLGP